MHRHTQIHLPVNRASPRDHEQHQLVRIMGCIADEKGFLLHVEPEIGLTCYSLISSLISIAYLQHKINVTVIGSLIPQTPLDLKSQSRSEKPETPDSISPPLSALTTWYFTIIPYLIVPPTHGYTTHDIPPPSKHQISCCSCDGPCD